MQQLKISQVLLSLIVETSLWVGPFIPGIPPPKKNSIYFHSNLMIPWALNISECASQLAQVAVN